MVSGIDAGGPEGIRAAELETLRGGSSMPLLVREIDRNAWARAPLALLSQVGQRLARGPAGKLGPGALGPSQSLLALVQVRPWHPRRFPHPLLPHMHHPHHPRRQPPRAPRLRQNLYQPRPRPLPPPQPPLGLSGHPSPGPCLLPSLGEAYPAAPCPPAAPPGCGNRRPIAEGILCPLIWTLPQHPQVSPGTLSTISEHPG